jgi:hypothetical protein
MADLPDLDTNEIGYLAYWNAVEDGGVNTIEPEEALTDNQVSEYTIYDNGWEGTYVLDQAGRHSSADNRRAKARVKNDGWIVVYMDRTEDYQTDASYPIHGHWDVVRRWTDGYGYRSSTSDQPDLYDNQLATSLESLVNNLENSDSISYDTSAVGLYNFEYSEAEATTALTVGSDSTVSPSFTYTSGTDLLWTAVFASRDTNFGNTPEASFEGVTILESQDGYGAIDPVARGLIPNAETEYTGYANPGGRGIVHGTLAIWR